MKIQVISSIMENADSPIKLHTVYVNGEAAYSPFGHLPDARAAAFIECCKASKEHSEISIEEISI